MQTEKDYDSRYAKIIVNNLDYPPGSDIHIGFNGKKYNLKEGKEEVVPEGVLEILQNAVREIPEKNAQGMLLDKYTGDALGEGDIKNMKMKKHPRFTIQVLRAPARPSGRKTEEERERLRILPHEKSLREREESIKQEIAESREIPLEEDNDYNADNSED